LIDAAIDAEVFVIIGFDPLIQLQLQVLIVCISSRFHGWRSLVVLHRNAFVPKIRRLIVLPPLRRIRFSAVLSVRSVLRVKTILTSIIISIISMSVRNVHRYSPVTFFSIFTWMKCITVIVPRVPIAA
jgi:hypothetical protein